MTGDGQQETVIERVSLYEATASAYIHCVAGAAVISVGANINADRSTETRFCGFVCHRVRYMHELRDLVGGIVVSGNDCPIPASLTYLCWYYYDCLF